MPSILVVGPAPHGAGGLKYILGTHHNLIKRSRPARGGWIEIVAGGVLAGLTGSPAPHGAGGLKFTGVTRHNPLLGSRPARGGWIEIRQEIEAMEGPEVPPRTGRVD